MKIGRNEPCRCGSGVKAKRCCGTRVAATNAPLTLRQMAGEGAVPLTDSLISALTLEGLKASDLLWARKHGAVWTPERRSLLFLPVSESAR